ncbi:unnamed protein product [Boreogadus saida]
MQSPESAVPFPATGASGEILRGPTSTLTEQTSTEQTSSLSETRPPPSHRADLHPHRADLHPHIADLFSLRDQTSTPHTDQASNPQRE